MSRLGILVSFLLVAMLSAGLASVAAQDDLSQTYTSENGTISFDMPEEWVAMEIVPGSGLIFFGSSEDALGWPSAGQFSGTLVEPPVFGQMLRAQADDPGADINDTLTTFVGDTLGGNAPAVIELTETTVGDKAAWQFAGATEYQDYLYLFIQITEDEWLALEGETAVGEMAAFEPTLTAIAETIEYTPGESADEFATGVWGVTVGAGETFKVMLINVAGDKLDYIGIICAPYGRVSGDAIFTLGGDIPISSDGEFTFETDQVVIEGQFISPTEATGTLSPLEDLSFCGILGDSRWSANCELNLTNISDPTMWSNTVSPDGQLTGLELDGFSFNDSATGSCDVAE